MRWTKTPEMMLLLAILAAGLVVVMLASIPDFPDPPVEPEKESSCVLF